MFWPHRRTPRVTRAGISPEFSREFSRGGIPQRAAHLARGSGGSDRGAEGISEFSAHGVLTPSPAAATRLRLFAGRASYLWEVNMEIRGSRMHFFKQPRVLLRAAGRGGRRSSRDSFDVGDLAHNISHAFKNCPTSAVQLARLRIPRSDFQTTADVANVSLSRGGGGPAAAEGCTARGADAVFASNPPPQRRRRTQRVGGSSGNRPQWQ